MKTYNDGLQKAIEILRDGMAGTNNIVDVMIDQILVTRIKIIEQNKENTPLGESEKKISNGETK
jgi:hypothetical protein